MQKSSYKGVQLYLNKFQFEFDTDYLIDRLVLKDGFWELFVTSYIHNMVAPGMFVVDIGANAGYHTLLMADCVGEAGLVIAFEPNPVTRSRLVRNLELNPELLKRVRVSDCGVGSSEQKLYLSCDDRLEARGNASLIQEAASPDLQEVHVVSLDEYIDGNISLIKIDVEGMELEVLKGAKGHLLKSHPIIIYETLTSIKPEVHQEIELYLKKIGYKIYSYTKDGTEFIEVSYPNYPLDDCVAIYTPD